MQRDLLRRKRVVSERDESGHAWRDVLSLRESIPVGARWRALPKQDK